MWDAMMFMSRRYNGLYVLNYILLRNIVKPVYNDHLCKKNVLPVIYLVMCFNEDLRYQNTLANNFCLLELI